MIAEWNIQSPARQCAATGAEFQEGDRIASVLLWRNGAYERIDTLASEPAPEIPEDANVLSSWKGAYKAPLPPTPETLSKDDAEGLLRRLLAVHDPAQDNSCYILGLMLERKRLLKELDRRDVEGKPVLIYEHLPSGETWIVPNPPLRLDEMDRVQTEVGQLLGGVGVPAPVSAPALVPAEVPAEAQAPVQEEVSPAPEPPASEFSPSGE